MSQVGINGMHVDVIDSIKALTELRRNWDAVYDADPEAQLFLSWAWIFNWFAKLSSTNTQWIILAVKPSAEASSYAAFFPLQLRTQMNKEGGFYNEIRMGGAEFADYTGFICLPEFQDEAIPALAKYVRQLNWTGLILKSVHASDRRFRLFMKPFAQTRFVVEEVERLLKDSKVDCSLFPSVTLPDDWETYLRTKLSSNTRQKAKRFLKKLDEGGELRITHADADTLGRDLEMLLEFWQLQWGHDKGDRLRGILSTNRTMLTSAFKSGQLFMPVLWIGDRPLGALGILVDKTKKTLHFLIGGRDGTFNSPPPGFILHMYAIRWAIQNGFKVYDFLQGNEPYKYMFGSEERKISTFVVRTRNRENLGNRLDARCLPYVLAQTQELHKKSKFAQAERGYRQILEVEPEHPLALYLLGQLMATRRRHGDAAEFFKAFLNVKPEVHKAWFRLGKTLQAQGDRKGALESFRKVLELDPGNREVPPLLVELSPASDLLRRVTAQSGESRSP